MRLSEAKKQTFFLSAVNAVVRALGLGIRVVLSRLLGAELMGITELAQSVHMLTITPLTSGLPAAVSRMTALSKPRQRDLPLVAGIGIVRFISAFFIPFMLITAPLAAKGLGDVRVLPSLWFSAPCILILGYSAVYNGYCYGISKSIYPAISELIEQFGRLFLIVFLYNTMHALTAPWLAAVPVLATTIAETVGLIYVIKSLKFKPSATTREYASMQKTLVRLAAPTTVSRTIQTFLRSLLSVFIPIRLQSSGLQPAEATAQLGMLNGMVMPILMLPCIFTSALSMVAIPKFAKAEKNPAEFKRLFGICIMACIPLSVAASFFVFFFAPVFSNTLYRMPELTPLFRICAPMTILFSFTHMSSNILSALGMQKSSMYTSVATAVVTVGLTYLLTSSPQLRIKGAVYAQIIGQILSTLSSLLILVHWKKRQAR